MKYQHPAKSVLNKYPHLSYKEAFTFVKINTRIALLQEVNDVFKNSGIKKNKAYFNKNKAEIKTLTLELNLLKTTTNTN